MKEYYFNRYRNFRLIYTIILAFILGITFFKRYGFLERVLEVKNSRNTSEIVRICGDMLTTLGKEHMDALILLFLLLPYIFMGTFYMKIIEEGGMKDPLTGIYLRGRIRKLIPVIQKNHGKEWIMIYMDLDGLKLVNDTMGHKAGDEHIVNFTRVIGSVIRKSDHFLRMGGDEFLVLLRGIEEKDRFTLIQRFYILRERADISFSIGAIVFRGRKNFKKKDLETLILKADNRMYRDKSFRRNLKSWEKSSG